MQIKNYFDRVDFIRDHLSNEDYSKFISQLSTTKNRDEAYNVIDIWYITACLYFDKGVRKNDN